MVPKPEYWAIEASILLKTQLGEARRGLEQCKVDLVFFNRALISHASMINGLVVFLDGHGHFPWLYTNVRGGPGDLRSRRQRRVDKRISVIAANEGFHILRVCHNDHTHVLEMIHLAWKMALQSTTGWVMVSSQWNTGAALRGCSRLLLCQFYGLYIMYIITEIRVMLRRE